MLAVHFSVATPGVQAATVAIERGLSIGVPINTGLIVLPSLACSSLRVASRAAYPWLLTQRQAPARLRDGACALSANVCQHFCGAQGSSLAGIVQHQPGSLCLTLVGRVILDTFKSHPPDICIDFLICVAIMG